MGDNMKETGITTLEMEGVLKDMLTETNTLVVFSKVISKH